MEDLPIGAEITLKVVETEKDECNGCFFNEICSNIYDNVCGDFSLVWVLKTKWRCRYECSNTSKSPLPFLWKKMLQMWLLES